MASHTHKKIGGNAQSDIHEDTIPESSKRNEAKGRHDVLDGATGASDADNGGGAGAGIPDGDTAMNAGDAVTRGNVDEDREKLFPEARTKRS